MKLLAALEAWQIIAVVTVVVAALIVIICLIIWAVKKNKKKKNAEENKKSARKKETKSVGSSESEGAYAEAYGEAEPARNTVRKTESKPAAESKPVQKAEAKPERDTGKVYHISKRKEDGRWQIKAEGGARAIKLFNTQAEAMEYGKQLAINQDARIMIHKLDGSFRKLTY